MRALFPFCNPPILAHVTALNAQDRLNGIPEDSTGYVPVYTSLLSARCFATSSGHTLIPMSGLKDAVLY